MKITRRQLRQIITESVKPYILKEEIVTLAGLHQKQSLKEAIAYINEDYEGPPIDEPLTMRFDFKRGKSNTDSSNPVTTLWHDRSATDDETIAIWLDKAISSDQAGYKPIKIVAGTSGTGSEDQNKVVLNKRVDAAFDYLNKLMEDENIRGVRGHRFDPVTVRNLAIIEYEIDLLAPGDQIEVPLGSKKYIVAPSDPDSPEFIQYQFVEITLTDPGKMADPVELARDFVDATLGTTGPAYVDTPAGRTSVLNVGNKIASILSKLRNASEFEAFNDTVKTLSRRGKDFYEIAETATLNIPSWIPGVGGKSLGPREIPADVTEINGHLKRLGQEPLT